MLSPPVFWTSFGSVMACLLGLGESKRSGVAGHITAASASSRFDTSGPPWIRADGIQALGWPLWTAVTVSAGHDGGAAVLLEFHHLARSGLICGNIFAKNEEATKQESMLRP
jgi:hypothetical protein